MIQLNQLLLDQLEREIAATRNVVDRVPEGMSDWKPHPKSMPMGYLAALVAGMFGWIAIMVDSDHLDLGMGGGETAKSGGERLALFEKSVAAARRALSGATEEHLMKPWQLLVNGTVVDEKPRHIPPPQ
jgi:hypothetical protein